ncbi:MAG: FHA domain-containing serine/threonine-protein kinase [Vulcanimicrobiota bacterium]
MEDEATAAVSQTFEQTFLPLELRVMGADLQVRVIPLGVQSVPLELKADEQWRVHPQPGFVRLLRVTGSALININGQALESAELKVGEAAELSGYRLWLVDTRSPWLGSLEGLHGEVAGQRWDLGYQAYRIGRRGSTRHNDIEINHGTVSRVQATVLPDLSGGLLLLCETQTSPVRLNGEAVGVQTSRRLNSGDTVQFGELSFRFRKAQSSSAPNYFPTDGSLPERVGPYPVVGLLGSGAMGVVYEGRDGLSRAVAIKVPLPNLLKDSDFVHRFNREMKLGASLDHPRLTKILHFQEAGGPEYPYLVMEKLLGKPLDQVTLPLELGQALNWAGQLLEALGYLHQHGVVHRDLKPANLYMTEQGLKVADLGIAHNSQTMANLTQTGTILGTPAYIDPAMLRGEPCDARSDLYSAGVVLYEWLAGSLPYPNDAMQTFRIKLTDDLPPLTRWNPSLPEEVCRFVDRLIHPEREARFLSAEAALLAFDDLLRRG